MLWPGEMFSRSGHGQLDYEMSAGLEVSGNVLEAGNLFFLGAEVPDCVENRVGERELAFDGSGREVPDDDGDVVAAGLFAQLLHHL